VKLSQQRLHQLTGHPERLSFLTDILQGAKDTKTKHIHANNHNTQELSSSVVKVKRHVLLNTVENTMVKEKGKRDMKIGPC